MFASPIAWADDDRGRGGGDRGRGDEEGRRVTFVAPAPATTVVQRRDDDDENENRAVVSTAAPLVNAINNEVANLMNGEVNVQEEDEADHPPAPGRQGTMQVTAAEGIEYLKAAGEEKLLEVSKSTELVFL